MDDDNGPMRPLWPLQAAAHLDGPVTLSSMATSAGIPDAQMAMVIEELERQGLASLMLTPVCRRCAALTGHYEDGDDLPEVVMCPICNAMEDIDSADVRLVYVVTKWPV